MNKKEKLELYYHAKEAYYNGQEIMTDFEFDQLEKELGLENKAQVGARHNPSYTIVHPFIMGSLSKVQIHKDKEGNIDWRKYFTEAAKYFGHQEVIVTPKFDGCSFECEVKDNKMLQISSRGDGETGKDLMKHVAHLIPQEFINIPGWNVFRGEVLVSKSVFEKKYAEQFTNPRSFVSGVLNRDYSDDEEFLNMLNDLSIVIYDYRKISGGIIKDRDWHKLNVESEIKEWDSPTPKFWTKRHILNEYDFEEIYNAFANYRHECPFALDGFVIKPTEDFRINNTTEHRPSDCVAIKFIPMLEETEVVNITWNLGKTGEYTPIIWVNPVNMDGRDVQKCSGHNYGYLKSKGVTIGSKVIMSLAGDIIPFLYKVTQTNDGEIPMPEGETLIDDIHLMAVLNEKDHAKLKFIYSANSLNIPNIGGETAKKIFDYISSVDPTTADFFDEDEPTLKYNILECTPEEIYFGAGAGKNGSNAKKAFEEVLKQLTLTDIIKSCSFKLCGSKVAEQCASYILTGDADFEHLATEGYQWVKNENSNERKEINEILNKIGMTVDDFKVVHEAIKKTTSNQIPVILTGEPNDYKSKGEFLACHPEYRQTGSWKEVQIVFTNSLESNTGKMKKAREKGIELRLY